MPTRRTTNFAHLKEDDEFEALVRDICALEWGDSNTQRFGRSGQKQFGVDIYGLPVDADAAYRAAQCKLRKTGKPLTEAEIEAEITSAGEFPHKLDRLILVTDVPRDTHTQILVDDLSAQNVKVGRFPAAIWFWDDVTERLASYPELILKYFGDHITSLVNVPLAVQLIRHPLQVIYFATTIGEPLAESLENVGIRVVRRVPGSGLGADANEVARIDGLIFNYVDWNLAGAYEKLSPERLAQATYSTIEQLPPACPATIIIPTLMSAEFRHVLAPFLTQRPEVELCVLDEAANSNWERLLHRVFRYGYERRGSLTTVDVSVRTVARPPGSALLDADWQRHLGVNRHPTPAGWSSTLMPALAAFERELTALPENTLVQIDAKVPVPAAIALGFALNIRVLRLGVWARRSGASDFKRQYWASDGEVAPVSYALVQLIGAKQSPRTAIVELTTHVSIHPAVEAFVQEVGIVPDIWMQLAMTPAEANLDEAHALAFASSVGQHIRELTAAGITDTHVFARLPAALGVLVGQRLVACGRVHLYWYVNPTYRFAFTLQ